MYSPVNATFNVKDYGARGDGVTADDSAFKEALADLAFSGGTLLIPAGTYRLTKQLEGPFSGVTQQNPYAPNPLVPFISPPTVSSSASDFRFYEVEIQTASGSTGTLRWRPGPLAAWAASRVPFTVGTPVALSGTPASITFDQLPPATSRFLWRGAGAKTFTSSYLDHRDIVIRGAGRDLTVLDFDFSASGNLGDGIVVGWSTRTQPPMHIRIADLWLRNLSTSNKCGLSAITTAGSPPAGFSVTGSPILATARFRVEVTSAGTPGAGLQFRWTRVWNSATSSARYWSLPQVTDADGKVELPGTGVTIQFPTSPALSVGQAWMFEATGYGGSAILGVGASGIELERVWTAGFKIGLTNDAGIGVLCRDCSFMGNSTGVLDEDDQSVGMLVANGNLYSPSTLGTNIVSVTGGYCYGRFGVVDFGGANRRYVGMQHQAGTAYYFGTADEILVEDCYFEAVSVSHFETDFSGAIHGLTIRNCFISNTNEIPAVPAPIDAPVPLLINRMPINGLTLDTVTVVGGTPYGTAPLPYGVPAAQNNALIRGGGSHLARVHLINCAMPLSAAAIQGVLCDIEPSFGAYRGTTLGDGAGYANSSLHGFDT